MSSAGRETTLLSRRIALRRNRSAASLPFAPLAGRRWRAAPDEGRHTIDVSVDASTTHRLAAAPLTRRRCAPPPSPRKRGEGKNAPSASAIALPLQGRVKRRTSEARSLPRRGPASDRSPRPPVGAIDGRRRRPVPKSRRSFRKEGEKGTRCGEIPKAAAAPATVSGEPGSEATGADRMRFALGRRRRAATREPGDLPSQPHSRGRRRGGRETTDDHAFDNAIRRSRL